MDFKTTIQKIPHLSKIRRTASLCGVDVFLVGGFLRDLLLKGEPSKLDFDFALKLKVLAFAREFSRRCKGRVVILDKALRNVRVVVRFKKEIINYDFSKFREETLTQDLRKRDFTVNTLALKVNDFRNLKLIDDLGGLKDIRAKTIRCASSASLNDDPLRIMRAFSLSALFGLGIEKKTRDAIAKAVPLLSKAASERVSDELFKILSVKDSYKTIVLMDRLGVLEKIFPEIRPMRRLGQGSYHHLDVLDHSLESLKCFEALVAGRLKDNRQILAYLDQKVAQNRTRAQLIKFACLFHDVGKPKACRRKKKKTFFHGHEKIGRDMVEVIARRLRLSFNEKEFVKHLIYLHLRPGYLADIKRPSKRAVYRYFRDTGEESVGILLLSLSDWRATRGPLTNLQRRRKHEKIMLSLIDDYFDSLKRKPLKRLVSGYDIMKKLKIFPSPLVGVILKDIKELQALGRVSTKAQALEAAVKMRRKHKG